jgi:acetolactate synthase regulatory subunit
VKQHSSGPSNLELIIDELTFKASKAMNLNVVDQNLQIELTFFEQLLAVRFNKLWQIPLVHITQVTTAFPEKRRQELRAPGVFFTGSHQNGNLLHRPRQRVLVCHSR